jgi:SAM-dependent methyltransferase
MTMQMMKEEAFFPATVMPDPDWWHALWPDPEEVLRALGIGPGLEVVDLCCGDGHFTAPLARLVAPGPAIGFDLDPAMLAESRRVCANCTNCLWIEGDAMALSQLVPDPVDYVLMANTFHGVAEPTALAREVVQVLKPGGRFVIVNWYPLPREETPVLGLPRGPRSELRMSPEQTCAVIDPAGFELEELAELPPYHYGAIFKKTGG